MKPDFAADRTLGKLVKWLRLMGFDTIFESDATGNRFEAFNETDRMLLTRIRRLWEATPPGSGLWIESNDPGRQIRQVISHLKLDYSALDPYTRCLRCNQKLAGVSRMDTYGVVPDHVWETQANFTQCPGCRRIFWPGSHIDRSRQKLIQLFSG